MLTTTTGEKVTFVHAELNLPKLGVVAALVQGYVGAELVSFEYGNIDGPRVQGVRVTALVTSKRSRESLAAGWARVVAACEALSPLRLDPQLEEDAPPNIPPVTPSFARSTSLG